MHPEDLAEIERSTYRTAVDHGIWDIALGVFLVIMGLCIALHVAYLVGVFTGIAIPSLRAVQASLLEPRVGYVQLSPKRTKQIYWALCIAAIAAGVLIVAPILVSMYTGLNMGKMPGVPALLTGQLLAVPVALAGYLLELKRLYLYALLICAAIAAAYLAQIRYDAVIASTGVAIVIVGGLVLRHFLSRYPVVKEKHAETR